VLKLLKTGELADEVKQVRQVSRRDGVDFEIHAQG
jgi:hypothetical protein